MPGFQSTETFPREQHHKAPQLQGAEICRSKFSPLLIYFFQRLLRHPDRVRCALVLTVSEAFLNPTEDLHWNSTDGKSNPKRGLAAFSTGRWGGPVWRIRWNYFTFFYALKLQSPLNLVFLWPTEVYYYLIARGIPTDNSHCHYKGKNISQMHF